MSRTSPQIYLKQRKRFKADCQARNAPCWLADRCVLNGQPIDYTAKAFTPYAFEVDHAIPASVRPDLNYAVANWRPSHAKCNRARQAKHVDEMPRVPQGPWVKPAW